VTIDGVDISAHAANANAHHNQQHAITGSDHTVTGSQYQIVGLTGTNTLGLLTAASSPEFPHRRLVVDRQRITRELRRERQREDEEGGHAAISLSRHMARPASM
jgi:hypothetical protein